LSVLFPAAFCAATKKHRKAWLKKERLEMENKFEQLFELCDLLPAVVQDADTLEVLMLAYMNLEAFKMTMETRRTWFFSRSRGKLWNKGETSGNYQDVVSIYLDCDSDTILVKVHPHGPACHTGHNSCFFTQIR
jgi:phosphoribosyl-AMP cyclohydrolase